MRGSQPCHLAVDCGEAPIPPELRRVFWALARLASTGHFGRAIVIFKAGRVVAYHEGADRLPGALQEPPPGWLAAMENP